MSMQIRGTDLQLKALAEGASESGALQWRIDAKQAEREAGCSPRGSGQIPKEDRTRATCRCSIRALGASMFGRVEPDRCPADTQKLAPSSVPEDVGSCRKVLPPDCCRPQAPRGISKCFMLPSSNTQGLPNTRALGVGRGVFNACSTTAPAIPCRER